MSTIESTRTHEENIIVEDITKMIGKDAIYIQFQYDHHRIMPTNHASSTLRALTPDSGEFQRASIDVPLGGHRCYRWVSLGSLLSIMHGMPPVQGGRWNLLPGMLAPAMYTDKDIKTRVYCYGTLFAACKEGKATLLWAGSQTSQNSNMLGHYSRWA